MDKTLAEVLHAADRTLTPAERRIVRVIMADYPVAGLQPAARLAKNARVSTPTVLRLMVKLGVGSYPQMQELLHAEIAARTSSPRSMYEAQQPSGQEDAPAYIQRSYSVLSTSLRKSFDALSHSEIGDIVDELADHRRRLHLIGGRFSFYLAQYLAIHLQLMRPKVHVVPLTIHERSIGLLDLSAKDTVIAFDFRRYDDSTVKFVTEARQRRSHCIVFTDPWLSPAAKHANQVVVCQVDAPSPFDSLTPAMALVETVIAGLVSKLGRQPQERVVRFDTLVEQLQQP